MKKYLLSAAVAAVLALPGAALAQGNEIGLSIRRVKVPDGIRFEGEWLSRLYLGWERVGHVHHASQRSGEAPAGGVFDRCTPLLRFVQRAL